MKTARRLADTGQGRGQVHGTVASVSARRPVSRPYADVIASPDTSIQEGASFRLCLSAPSLTLPKFEV